MVTIEQKMFLNKSTITNKYVWFTRTRSYLNIDVAIAEMYVEYMIPHPTRQ